MPSPANLFASIVFGLIGFAAFMYGKKNAVIKPMVIGLTLMIYPYFVPQTWLLYAIGCALTVGLVLFR
jgi:hypothetical protein